MNELSAGGEPSRQIHSLQAGRALAALAVVVHHATLAAESFSGVVPGSAVFHAGYLGVDFFFVLSGFIIYYSIVGKTLAEYSLARFRRVYLPYLPVGVGLALLYTIAPDLSASAEREWSWVPTLTLLPVQEDSALSVAWTLKHEILFYFVFGALYFCRLLSFGLAVWGIAILIAAFTNLPTNVPLALINLEFLFGIGVAVAYGRGWSAPAWYLVSVLMFGVWLGLGAERDYSVLVGLSFATFMLPTIGLEKHGHIQVPAWLLALGAASYSIYLVHGVAISFVARITAGQHWTLILVTSVASGILLGIAYFRWVERKLLLIS